MQTRLAEQLAEAGMLVARHTSIAACIVALVEQAVRLTEASDAAFVGAGRLAAVISGSPPDIAVRDPAAPFEVVGENDAWFGIRVCDDHGTRDWSGTLWLHQARTDDALVIAQVLARQAAVALTSVLRAVELERRAGQSLALVEAGKSLSQELTLQGVLRRIVELACELVDARYGALGVVDPQSGSSLSDFITVGMDDATQARIGRLPTGKGLLGALIDDPRPLRIPDISRDARSAGMPAHHPPMNSFLGVPIHVRGEARGRLYLTEKQGADEFSDDDEQLALLLASQAGIAIENAELYEQLQHTAQELAAANEHKSAFLASMSHELRSPLNTILGYTRLLLDEDDKLDVQQQEDLEIVQASGLHLLRLITDLLDMSRIEAGRMQLHPELVDLAALVHDAAAAMHPQVAGTGVELRLDVEGDLQLTCDPTRVRQMLLNVLTNAIKFTVEGSITVRAEHHDTSVELTIVDTGPGIPQADLDRIFESFYQSTAARARTPGAQEGAGLGLAITRMLAELHGGTVSIASTQGVGTTVSIILPVRPVSPGSSEEPS